MGPATAECRVSCLPRDGAAPTLADARVSRYEQSRNVIVTEDELRMLTRFSVMPFRPTRAVRQLVQELALDSEMWSR